MTAAELSHQISVEDYLIGEPTSNVKHEYIAGQVYAMAGASWAHNRISLRLSTLLDHHLNGGRCTPFTADMRVRLVIKQQHLFYYPDVVVTCDERDTNQDYLRFPKLIIEVLSESTQRIDQTEKLANYLTIPTLEEYVLVAQDQPQVTLYRQRTGWQPETVCGLDAVLELESVNFTIPLRALYEKVLGNVG